MLIDASFVILMALACFRGLRKGFIIAVFSLLALIIALAAAVKLSTVVAAQIASYGGSGKWWPLISFLIVFIAMAMLVNICGRLLQKTFEIAALGWVNRIAGVFFFAALYTIIFSVFLFYAVQLHMIGADTVNRSVIYPLLAPVGPEIINGFGALIPFFKDMFVALQQFFSNFTKPA